MMMPYNHRTTVVWGIGSYYISIVKEVEWSLSFEDHRKKINDAANARNRKRVKEKKRLKEE